MSIYGMVSDTIKRYGSSASVKTQGNTINTKAFIEPLRLKSKVYVGGERRLVGYDRTEKYLYIGLPEIALTENLTVIETAVGKYIVNRCEIYYVNDTPVYMWAILKTCGDDLEDDYESD